MRHLYVVTGASRGMGEAIAQQLLSPGHLLLCISRSASDVLAAQARSTGAACVQWQADLAKPVEVAARLQAWLGEQQTRADDGAFATATLVNNAALLTRIGPLDGCDDRELSDAMRVGVEAPVLLTAAFLRATRGWAATKRVLNISSGLGRRAMAGQATYCAVKAGLDHFSRALALDEAHRRGGASVVSLAPGVIDTGMQAQLRGGDPAGFPDRETFVGLKEKGQLASPADAAAQVLAFLSRADFGTRPVADVRDV